MSTTIKQVFRSFIIVPFLATSLSISSFNAVIDQVVTREAENDAAKQAQVERVEKAGKINAYFAQNNMPLARFGMKMVLEAEKNDLDWRMIPAIAVRESSGGIHACKSKNAQFNPFGWNSCKSGFKSYDDAIERLAQHLGGNHPRTSHYYNGKENRAILQTYNPPSIVATYADEVLRIMAKIEATEI